MISLTALQKRVLAEITWDCRATVDEVAKRIGSRPHSVRYAIGQLREMLGFIPFCWTNPFRQGQTPHRIFFSVSGTETNKRARLVEYLQRLPEVFWMYELYGQYQFLVALRTEGLPGLRSVLRDFDEKFGDMVVSRSFSIMTRVNQFMPWAAHCGKGSRKVLSYHESETPVQLDEIDLKILDALRMSPLASFRNIAQMVGIPISTASYRVDNLRKKGVILGFAYGYESRRTGSESFLILVRLNGLGCLLYDRFLEFSRNHPNVNHLTQLIGDWDMELLVTVDHAHDLSDIIHQIHRIGAGSVRDIIAHAFGRELKE